jgi:16S rRNA (guanine527-N7)-methyltransferase
LDALLTALAAEPDPPTTVSTPAAARDRHLADSLSGLEAPPLRGARRIADIGAGAGFPGLALAVALPEARVDLVEATARKCEVIDRLARAAGLANARAVAARAEDWAGGEGAAAYDVVTARALAPLAVLAEYAAPLLALGGALVAWKGARDGDQEAAAATAAGELGLEAGEILAVEPFRGAENRHLHIFEKVAATPDRFPRRAGMARKRPLGKTR